MFVLTLTFPSFTHRSTKRHQRNGALALFQQVPELLTRQAQVMLILCEGALIITVLSQSQGCLESYVFIC